MVELTQSFDSCIDKSAVIAICCELQGEAVLSNMVKDKELKNWSIFMELSLDDCRGCIMRLHVCEDIVSQVISELSSIDGLIDINFMDYNGIK